MPEFVALDFDMIARRVLEAKGYRISKLDFDGSNLGLRGATSQG